MTTYSGIMSYIGLESEIRQVYISSEQRGFRKLNILHETKIVGKQCSDDFDEEQLKDQQSRVVSRVASNAS